MFIKAEDFEYAIANRHKAPWNKFYNASLSLADRLLTTAAPRIEQSRHNWILEQAKGFGHYSITLASAYRLTGDEKYAHRCWFFIEDALSWEQWYWDHESCGGYMYDLTTGEMAQFFATLLHLLENWFTQQHLQRIHSLLKERILNIYIKASGNANHKGKPAHWYTWHTNWNAVCNGGMLCLAFFMAKNFDEYKNIIPLALAGLDYYLKALHEDGSSIEGIGYWTYGVSYMTYALLNYEAYYGKTHPIFEKQVFRAGLSFPFDFSPSGAGISFGDSNNFIPSPFIYRLAYKAAREDIAQETTIRLLAEITKTPFTGTENSCFENKEIYALLFCKSELQPYSDTPAEKYYKMYPDNGWAIFKNNSLSLSFRSGSTNVPHAVKDLNSIQLAKNGVQLLKNIVNTPYTLGWFTQGRELYAESQSTTKNAALVNGCGQLALADASVKCSGDKVISDAVLAYPNYVKKASRAVALIDDGMLVTDQIKTDGDAWHELRFITPGDFTDMGGSCFMVKYGDQQAFISFTASCTLEFYICELINSIAQRESSKMLRVVTKKPTDFSEISSFIHP